MNQELLNQFLSLLEASSSFKLLSPEKQTAIRSNYENAADEQLEQGIQTLKEDQVVTAKLEAESKRIEEELVKQMVLVKGVLKVVKKNELKTAEAADDAASSKEMQGVLDELGVTGSTPKKEEPKPRKKFLGIF